METVKEKILESLRATMNHRTYSESTENFMKRMGEGQTTYALEWAHSMFEGEAMKSVFLEVIKAVEETDPETVYKNLLLQLMDECASQGTSSSETRNLVAACEIKATAKAARLLSGYLKLEASERKKVE